VSHIVVTTRSPRVEVGDVDKSIAESIGEVLLKPPTLLCNEPPNGIAIRESRCLAPCLVVYLQAGRGSTPSPRVIRLLARYASVAVPEAACRTATARAHSADTTHMPSCKTYMYERRMLVDSCVHMMMLLTSLERAGKRAKIAWLS
jgi:hypothetical protein